MKKLITALGVALSLGISASAIAKDSVKVGFVYVSPIGEAGWTYTHDSSRHYLEDKVWRQNRNHFCRKRTRRGGCRACYYATG